MNIFDKANAVHDHIIDAGPSLKNTQTQAAAATLIVANEGYHKAMFFLDGEYGSFARGSQKMMAMKLATLLYVELENAKMAGDDTSEYEAKLWKLAKDVKLPKKKIEAFKGHHLMNPLDTIPECIRIVSDAYEEFFGTPDDEHEDGHLAWAIRHEDAASQMKEWADNSKGETVTIPLDVQCSIAIIKELGLSLQGVYTSDLDGDVESICGGGSTARELIEEDEADYLTANPDGKTATVDVVEFLRTVQATYENWAHEERDYYR